MKSVKFAVLSLLVACGGGSGSDDDGPVVLPDSGPTPDSPPAANCLLPASLGTVTPANSFAEYTPNMEDAAQVDLYVFGAPLNADPAPDALFLELYNGFGAFASGYPASGDVAITGAETNYATCGACVVAVTDIDSASGMSTGDPYVATAGSINFTSISKTSLAGTISNLTLTHVTINAETFESTPHADGCSSTLTSVEFSAVPEMAMPNATNQPNARTRYRLQLRMPTR